MWKTQIGKTQGICHICRIKNPSKDYKIWDNNLHLNINLKMGTITPTWKGRLNYLSQLKVIPCSELALPTNVDWPYVMIEPCEKESFQFILLVVMQSTQEPWGPRGLQGESWYPWGQKSSWLLFTSRSWEIVKNQLTYLILMRT